MDYLKVDGCFSNPAAFDDGFPKFTQALNATGRPMVLSYEWPLYQTQVGIKVLQTLKELQRHMAVAVHEFSNYPLKIYFNHFICILFCRFHLFTQVMRCGAKRLWVSDLAINLLN